VHRPGSRHREEEGAGEEVRHRQEGEEAEEGEEVRHRPEGVVEEGEAA